VALALTPFYYRGQMHKPETQAVFFRAVADQSKIPVLLYNIPQVTGYDLPVDTIAELSHHPNIIGMKDSSGNVEKLKQTVKAVKPEFQVLSGSGVSFGEALEVGAAGAILAIANAASLENYRRQVRNSRFEIRHGPERILWRSSSFAFRTAFE
jgi:4-hydroxy-2-oxoglutarate aldolase